MTDLDRFVRAQAPLYDQVLAELKTGRKTTHWMWFVFPQLAGLGRSETARFYALADRVEAAAYLGHPVLGPRLREDSVAVLAWAGRRSVETIFGGIDAVKLRSSMTLFEAVGGDAVFGDVLDAFFDGARDAATLDLLAANRPEPR